MEFQQQTPITEMPTTTSILKYVRNELFESHGGHGKRENK